MTMTMFDTATLMINGEEIHYYPIKAVEDLGIAKISRLPYSIKILLEGVMRKLDGRIINENHVKQVANWNPESPNDLIEIPLMPSSIVLQDFTGIAVAVDLAALRTAMKRLNGDIHKINPLVPVDLVIDHSIQVDSFDSNDALFLNEEMEFGRNKERFKFFKWASNAFDNFRVVPPSVGIVHQVNLEYLSSVVQTQDVNGKKIAYPCTVVGTDSHTTMINGLGVLGWGVGGIEGEAAMLGQPVYFVSPKVVGFKLNGKLPEGTTATDLVLTITNILRKKGVVGKFVEFFGPGVSHLTLADRATVANMAPEYGATMGFFPVDQETLNYLRITGRTEEQIQLIEAYTRAQGLFRDDDMPDPHYTEVMELNLSTVQPTVAGPKRPQDRVDLKSLKQTLNDVLRLPVKQGGFGLTEEEVAATIPVQLANGKTSELKTGSLVLAAITSCTNTSNPSVMIAAGLLAKKAVERGLQVPPHVKTSLSPGSLVVTEYLKRAGLMPYLEQVGFNVVGYGCATCNGSSGPLIPEVEEAIRKYDLTVSSILSGNRNFEGRVHSLIKANYLASPPLVVAYALAGTLDFNLLHEPIGFDQNQEAVYLKDIWPTSNEINQIIQEHVTPDLFKKKYKNIFKVNQRWNSLEVGEDPDYEWDPNSNYIQEPPFLQNLEVEVAPIQSIRGARALVVLGDSITTDHISPAGSISAKSPAGEYLNKLGVKVADFNTYGARRGNHEVMIRGTFANVRLRNEMVPKIEGGMTNYIPTNQVMSIYDAAMKYQEHNQPTIIIAGKEYGSGSSRDWAAKGTRLLGVKAVLVESFERIHRSNLIGVGVLPLQFLPGESRKSHGLTGLETFDILGLDDQFQPKQMVNIAVTREDGSTFTIQAIARLDSPVEIEYYRHGGILQMMLRKFINGVN
ncbi:aconitate hydratase AcnA [Bacillus haynesii]|nr:aconitate hydratase AcnA [Bacillus haynesii]MEC1448624.1 aconitate hydratase AcnA [Bacillus haynesii]